MGNPFLRGADAQYEKQHMQYGFSLAECKLAGDGIY
jgi:hypothetical protein